MTTPTRDELLKLANESEDKEFVAGSDLDHVVSFFPHELERFATLLCAHQAQAEPKPSNADADLSAIYDLFEIGSDARTIGVLLTNVSNTLHFSKLLNAIEREFFMVPGKPDEDFPGEEPDDECLVNSWGSTKEQYVEQFRAALDRLRPLAWPSQAQEPSKQDHLQALADQAQALDMGYGKPVSGAVDEMKPITELLDLDLTDPYTRLFERVDYWMRLAISRAQQAPAVSESVAAQAVDIAAMLFDKWENGTACYEDPDDCSGSLGNAFSLSDSDFDRCCDFLNKYAPRSDKPEE